MRKGGRGMSGFEILGFRLEGERWAEVDSEAGDEGDNEGTVYDVIIGGYFGWNLLCTKC